MKKIMMLLLAGSISLGVSAQEDTTMSNKIKKKSEDGKTKIKDDKGKTKDDQGKMKIKDDPNSDMQTKTKTKDDKIKMKDDAGKVKLKGDGTMNNTTSGYNSGMGTNTSTTVNITTISTELPPVPATLPVVGNNVPADVVITLKNKYGSNIYDIKQIRSTSGQNIYVVRVFENGTTRTEYVGADGNTVSQ